MNHASEYISRDEVRARYADLRAWVERELTYREACTLARAPADDHERIRDFFARKRAAMLRQADESEARIMAKFG